MEYVPKKHRLRVFLSAAPLLLLCAGLIFCGVRFGLLLTLSPLIALLFALSAEALISEAAADHVYTLYGGVFRIYVKFGKSEKKIFDLDLRYAQEAVPYTELKKRKEKIKPSPRRLYCLCGAPKKSSVALIYNPGKRVHILCIAPNGTFYEALKRGIGSDPVDSDGTV